MYALRTLRNKLDEAQHAFSVGLTFDDTLRSG